MDEYDELVNDGDLEVLAVVVEAAYVAWAGTAVLVVEDEEVVPVVEQDDVPVPLCSMDPGTASRLGWSDSDTVAPCVQLGRMSNI